MQRRSLAKFIGQLMTSVAKDSASRLTTRLKLKVEVILS